MATEHNTTTPEHQQTISEYKPNDDVVAHASVSRVIRRQRIFLWIIGAAAVLAIAGLILSLFVKSPAQKAAEVAPPKPSVLTATVQRQNLTQSVAVRGNVVSAGTISVTGTLGAGTGPAIVTKLPVSNGASVNNGNLLAEISGQPLFAFAGSVPAYRDITVGTVGTDAAQLQTDLTQLGFLSARYDTQTFNAAGSKALQAFMKTKGYPASLDSNNQPMLPLSSMVFLPTLPATVASVGAGVGDNLTSAQQPLLTITTGQLSVTAIIPSGSQTGLKVGQKLTIDDNVRGETVNGTIASLGAFTTGASDSNSSTGSGTSVNNLQGQGDATTPGYPLVAQADQPLSSQWLGENVLVTIVTGNSNGPQLVVPVTAITSGADGASSVTVLGSSNTRTKVNVTVGLISAGMAVVTPTGGGVLKEGQHVVLG